MSAIKIGPCDELFSLLVRGRVDFTCEYCGTYYPPGRRQGIDCSHYIGRANKRTRFDPDNAFAHCTKCHFFLGGNPHAFSRWAVLYLGEARYDALAKRSNELLKVNAAVYHSIRLHLKRELDIMTERRNLGEQGRIEFKAWDGTIAESAPRKSKPKKKSPLKKKLSGRVVKREAA